MKLFTTLSFVFLTLSWLPAHAQSVNPPGSDEVFERTFQLRVTHSQGLNGEPLQATARFGTLGREIIWAELEVTVQNKDGTRSARSFHLGGGHMSRRVDGAIFWSAFARDYRRDAHLSVIDESGIDRAPGTPPITATFFDHGRYGNVEVTMVDF